MRTPPFLRRISFFKPKWNTGRRLRFGSTGAGSFLLKTFFSLVLIGSLFSPGHAEPLSPTEYRVKAAFLYNFAKFVEWPPEAIPDGQPLVIGILGQDPFGNLIDEAVAGKTVRDRPLVIKRYAKIEEVSDANILFVGDSEGPNVSRILKRLGHAPVLTVSDLGRFAEEGGMVQLLVDQNRVRFAINVAAVEQAGLKPSSQLLKLARLVNPG